MVAGSARDIAVARQDLVIEQKLPDLGLRRIGLDEVVEGQRRGQVQRRGGCGETGEETGMRQMAAIMAAAAVLAGPAKAEIEQARDLLEAGEFAAALEAFWPAARSGNAEAEEWIGVIYALGLGVEQDYTRAFDWYLRAAMKGHPGAQSGIGWYYELGLGLPAPDLVRAYLWYNLSTIGGDPDAAISLEEVIKKMTPEEIEKAHILVEDYRVWMYPFR